MPVTVNGKKILGSGILMTKIVPCISKGDRVDGENESLVEEEMVKKVRCLPTGPLNHQRVRINT